jgi:hypothetical protein
VAAKAVAVTVAACTVTAAEAMVQAA